jgi:hypothetical protein
MMYKLTGSSADAGRQGLRYDVEVRAYYLVW